MQNLVTNKVENGYICTMEGKIWVMNNLKEVLHFMAKVFNEPHYENIKLIYVDPNLIEQKEEDESITEYSE